MTETWDRMQTHAEAITNFVHKWTGIEVSEETVANWRTWHGETVHVDNADEIVFAAIWAMEDGQWSLAAELLALIASFELVDYHRTHDDNWIPVKVERYRWDDS